MGAPDRLRGGSELENEKSLNDQKEITEKYLNMCDVVNVICFEETVSPTLP